MKVTSSVRTSPRGRAGDWGIEQRGNFICLTVYSFSQLDCLAGPAWTTVMSDLCAQRGVLCPATPSAPFHQHLFLSPIWRLPEPQEETDALRGAGGRPRACSQVSADPNVGLESELILSFYSRPVNQNLERCACSGLFVRSLIHWTHIFPRQGAGTAGPVPFPTALHPSRENTEIAIASVSRVLINMNQALFLGRYI